MRVFVAGASGAIGRPLVTRLVAAGHEVVAMTRTPAKADGLRDLGATPVVADALDQPAVHGAVVAAEPEAIVHQLTAIPDINLRRIDRDFATTNRLRTEATDHLLGAARAVGARRFVAQSFAGWPYAREGGPVKSEEDRLDPDPPPRLRAMLEAIRHLEGAVLAPDVQGGVVLRYGFFYGPGTSMAAGTEMVEAVRRRRFPIIGDGAGVWSFVHVDDAAAATVAALDDGAPTGVYNVVDDDPAPAAEWLPALAETLGAKRPMRMPRIVGRLAIGAHGVAWMTQIRGASNAKAKRDLGWQPAHASWRDGFRTALG